MPEKNFSEAPGEVAREQDTSSAAIDNVHFQTPAVSKITIDGNEITYDISSITLEQSINSHHVLQLRIRRVGVASGSGEFEDHSTYTGFLGKPISLEIKPEGEKMKILAAGDIHSDQTLAKKLAEKAEKENK